jgi:single-strand DNA-binding protein
MNHIVIKGRISATPEIKTTQNGNKVCTFSVAVDRPYSKNKETDFFRCNAWRGTAEFIEKYFGKGQEILIDGAMISNTYTAKDGSQRTSWDVQVNNVEFCGSKSSSSESSETKKPAKASKSATDDEPESDDDEHESDDDEDLPF